MGRTIYSMESPSKQIAVIRAKIVTWRCGEVVFMWGKLTWTLYVEKFLLRACRGGRLWGPPAFFLYEVVNSLHYTKMKYTSDIPSTDKELATRWASNSSSSSSCCCWCCCWWCCCCWWWWKMRLLTFFLIKRNLKGDTRCPLQALHWIDFICAL